MAVNRDHRAVVIAAPFMLPTLADTMWFMAASFADVVIREESVMRMGYRL